MMSEAGATVGLDRDDRRTHVERINPTPAGFSHVWAPGAGRGDNAMPKDRGEQKLYRMKAKGFHNGAMLRPGQTVMLYDDEVSAHHELVGARTPAPDKPHAKAPAKAKAERRR